MLLAGLNMSPEMITATLAELPAAAMQEVELGTHLKREHVLIDIHAEQAAIQKGCLLQANLSRRACTHAPAVSRSPFVFGNAAAEVGLR